jgi:oxysterol-binding protein-related protein 3/6/7
MLQRFCENFQYAGLLNRAAKDSNPYLRMALVSAFCVGGFAFNVNRTLKFFNPLLSETYEYVDNDLNFRYFGEQVSHHPAITACYAEGDGYTFYTNSNSAYKFLLMKGCLEFYPLGRSYITFENFNETITYTKPIAVCRNLIMGAMHLDTYGKVTVSNQSTGDVLELEIFEENKKERGKMIGEAKDIYGNIRMRLEGNMHSHLDIFFEDPMTGKEIKETIWQKIKIEGDEESRFYFTDFTINLNNLTDELKQVLPPSDSRFRPDQRALEVQDIDLATSEKHRLEEKQRTRRKENEKNKIKHKPIYFDETYDDLSGELIYKYKGNYFDDRNAKRFDKFIDLY